jgi:hypothetical protein
MNERIEKIAREAGFEMDQYGMFWDQDANVEGVDLEKFAELLIQEVLELNSAGTDVLSYYGITESDGKESIDVEFSNEEMLRYLLLAHAEDITFNKWLENALRKAVDAVLEDDDDASTEAGSD